MKKRFFLQLIIAVVVIASVGAGVSAYLISEVWDSNYQPCDDFYNIAVCFAGSGAHSRAFSFNTKAGDTYWDKCEIQLDPAEKQEQAPSFKDKDNITIATKSNENPIIHFDRTVIWHYGYTTELKADTKYFYRVGRPKGNLWSRWGYFITDDGDDSFTFMHITDSQAEGDAEYEAFAATLSKAFVEAPETEFILSTGDQVEFPFQSYWDKFFACIDDIVKITTFAAVNGNHEITTDTMQANFYVPTESDMYCYAYEYGDCLFMIIDTNYLSRDPSNYNDQLRYLANIMEHSTKKWRVIAAHKSPFSTGTHATNIDVLGFKDAIVPFAAQHNIDLVLSGHDHIYYRSFPVDGQGERASVAEVRQVQVGEYNATAYINPQGAIYVENRCIGTKFYNKVHSLNDHLLEKTDPHKIRIPMYSVVKIEGSKLIYTAYEHDRDTDTVSIYDCFEIIKN